MLKNYLKMAWRNIRKGRMFSIINMAGLAIGMAAAMFIMLFVLDELSYDRFHKDHPQIYRLWQQASINGKAEDMALTAPPMGPTIEADYPEVVESVRINPFSQKILVKQGETYFNEEGVTFVDSIFFSVFNFPLLQGDPDKVLNSPNQVVITEEMAKRYFGDENPVGQTLWFDLHKADHLEVTGVMADWPHNSHLKYDFLISWKTWEAAAPPQMLQAWFGNSLYTYLKLDEKADAAAFEAKLPEVYDKYMSALGKMVNMHVDFRLQPLADVYLDPALEWDVEHHGNAQNLWIFAAVGLFLLLIASINYMNLSTALSQSRFKEIGLRKTFGGQRSQLIGQFLTESVLLTVLSLLVALVLVELLLPWFNSFTGKEVSLLNISSYAFWPMLAGIVLLVGLLSGLYPAFYLSRFNPVETLRIKAKRNTESVLLRQGLVVFQFAIGMIMIVATAIVFLQLEFLKDHNLGFNPQQVLAVEVQDTTTMNALPVIQEELEKLPYIKETGLTSTLPGGLVVKQLLKVENKGTMMDMAPNLFFVDYDYVDVMDMKVVEGRNFSREMETDLKEGFIINEAMAQKMGWDEPLGKKIDYGQSPDGTFARSGRVIGVVEDFHFTSLKESVEPLIMMLVPKKGQYLLARVDAASASDAIAAVEGHWGQYASAYPFEYFFLDDYFNQQYRAEEKMGTLFTWFAILSIVIACLGLFGLASLTVAQRTKEIGIRKVMGASVRDIVLLINRDFVKLVLVAMVVAFPLAFYAMSRWLENFAYRIDIDWLPFVVAGGAALLVSFATVSWQAFRTAYRNPVKALRYE